MNSADLYPDKVLRHHRHPHNFGALPDCTHAAERENVLCGDHMRVELVLGESGCVKSMRFQGHACAVATATASMLSVLVCDLTPLRIATLREDFDALVDSGRQSQVLGEMNAIGAVSRYPSRRACARLPWDALRTALDSGQMAQASSAP